MRRPLTPNGVPLFQAVAGGAVLFDTNDLDPAYTYAVTVFCWFPPSNGANVGVGVASDGNPAVATGLWLSAGDPIDAFRVNGIGPAKVMDRVVIRGDQQVEVAALLAPYGAAGVWWWGYVERAGVSPLAMEYRPLQPSNNLQAPFSAPPVGIFIPAGGAPVTQTLHALDDSGEQRMDFLSLYVAATMGGVPAVATQACNLKVPGGVDIQIPVLDIGGGGSAGSPLHMYDNIPVRAPAAGDNLYQIEVVGAADVAVTVVAYGRFARA